MKTKHINGTDFERMVRNGLANLRKSAAEVNSLNVFPVPDGDTGTNMCLTLENGVINAVSDRDLGKYLKSLSSSMLLGARGNSGVILSQIFKGICRELASDSIANPGELTNAFICGYKTAYSAVIRPVEGTMLTVAREGIENIRQQIVRGTTVETLFLLYIAEMRKSLSYTPEMLPLLKEAGVVDSGGMGYILIVEGMSKALYGEIIEDTGYVSMQKEPQADTASFDENSEFTYGYCTEFLLQLMKSKHYERAFRLDSFIEDLRLYGDSLVAIQEGSRVKVHIHTRFPAKVIRSAQEYGEFVSFKLENMQLQHNEYIKSNEDRSVRKPVAVIAVANGDGIRSLYAEFGCDQVLNGGATMNTSAQEFINAFRRTNADRIVVLPNNKNSVRSAKQAAELYGAKNVTVIPTGNIAEGYFALAMDIGDSDDIDYRIEKMTDGMNSVKVISAAKAVRNCVTNGVECHTGDYVVFVDDKPAYSGGSLDALLGKCLSETDGISDGEQFVIFRGKGFTDEAESALEVLINEKCPYAEVTPLDCGQEIYELIIAVM